MSALVAYSALVATSTVALSFGLVVMIRSFQRRPNRGPTIGLAAATAAYVLVWCFAATLT